MPSRRKAIALPRDPRRDALDDHLREFRAVAERSRTVLQSQRQNINDILHDLKSPLARLNVALGLARQQTGMDAQAALDRIEWEAAKLNQMLQQLLGLARANAGIEMPAPRKIDLLGLVKDVTADANFEAVRANRTVHLLPCRPCTIHAEQGTLRSAIENVARNAVVHTAEGTAVEISVKRPRSGKVPLAIVSVRDHGQGVPTPLLAEIFRPFFRVENSLGRTSGGTGLGLAIAERAVRLHGGSISATNHPEGGLVVEMRLPAHARCETNASFEPAATSALN